MVKATDKTQLDEFKADGENSSVMDPVTPAGGSNKKRAADKSVGDKKADKVDDVTPKGNAAGKQSPVRRADKRTTKESMETLFSGQDLTEDFKAKASTIFEAAVNEAVEDRITILAEETEVAINERVDVMVTETEEKLENYVDYVADRYLEENELAIENNIKAQLADSLLESMREVFAEHNINIEDDQIDVLDEMALELEETEEKLNESLEENMELRNTLAESDREAVFGEMTEGLTDSEIDKLGKLSEGMDYADMDEFRSKITIIKESFFDKGANVITESASNDGLDPVETDDNDTTVVSIDEDINRYAANISKNIGKYK